MACNARKPTTSQRLGETPMQTMATRYITAPKMYTRRSPNRSAKLPALITNAAREAT